MTQMQAIDAEWQPQPVVPKQGGHCGPTSDSSSTTDQPDQLDVLDPLDRAFTLPNELLELILVCSIRSVTCPSTNKSFISAFLRTLPRSSIPAATQVALLLVPELPLEAAISNDGTFADVGLLEAMRVLSHAPFRRTLEWRPDSFLGQAASFGMIDVLDWWYLHRDSDLKLAYQDNVLPYATANGRLEVLHWWTTRQLSLNRLTPLDAYIWAAASSTGQEELLNWWKDTGLPLESAGDGAVDNASTLGHVKVLDWWKDLMGDSLKYSHNSVAGALQNKQYLVLDWWAKSGLKIIGDPFSLTRAAIAAKDMFAIDWLYENRLFSFHPTDLAALFPLKDRSIIDCVLKYYPLLPRLLAPPTDAFAVASSMGDVDILESILECGFALCPPVPGLEAAAAAGRFHVIEWWCGKYPTVFTTVSLTGMAIHASLGGHRAVLDWLDAKREEHDFGLNLPTEAELKTCISNGYLDVLQYWADPDPQCITQQLLFHAVVTGQERIVEWMFDEMELEPPSFYENKSIITEALRNGHAGTLKLWYHHASQGRQLGNSSMTDLERFNFVKSACDNGRLECLQWWFFIHGYHDHRLCEIVVEAASAAGHVAILEWIESVGGIRKWFAYSGFEAASRAAHVLVMDWWLSTFGQVVNIDIEACFPNLAAVVDHMSQPAFVSNMRSLAEWWANTPHFNFIIEHEAELPACFLVDPNVPVALIDKLLFVKKFQFPLSYSVLDVASKQGNVKLIDYWWSSTAVSIDAKAYSEESIRSATVSGHLTCLDWWHKKASSIELKMPFRSVQDIRRTSAPAVSEMVISWWSKSGLLPEADPGSEPGQNIEPAAVGDIEEVDGMNVD